jgi:DNA polymerase III subunit delta
VEWLYLFSGDDATRIEETRRRLRVRAEAEGGGGALEAFEPLDERRGPDADALAAALAAMSLSVTRRYILADRVERWKSADVDRVLPLLSEPPADTTLVLIARGKPPAKLATAVKSAGGELREFEAPRERQMPKWVEEQAARRGLRIDSAAARLLVERMGPHPLRLANELDRLAVWAGDAGSVSHGDLEEMVADTSEAMVWELSDALIERNATRAIGLAESLALSERGASIVYPVASRLRQAVEARTALDEGMPAKDVQSALRMSPYAAKQLVARVGDTSVQELRQAVCALADLEAWTRGEADYPEDMAVTLAIARAVGAG